jgi:hypothetical protein
VSDNSLEKVLELGKTHLAQEMASGIQSTVLAAADFAGVVERLEDLDMKNTAGSGRSETSASVVGNFRHWRQ